ncbi:MAG: gliding motility-associated C-terminal domain-containing protein [Tannerella sp.]|nr:gliding motility-associated C-terminal domain-containing protein [Tannerella sp.]
MNKKRKTGWLLVFMTFVCTAFAQQYSVTGGAKTPLLAVDNTNYRIQVYLVYGMENVKISFTSQSASHKWYRFRTRVDDLNPESVASEQTGTTSVISDVEDGCGYYVDENGAMRRYVWIIDYSKYEFDIRSMEIDPNVDRCMAIRFIGDADVKDMFYYTPTGTPTRVNREFEVVYGTLEWNNELKSFMPKTYKETFSGDPFAKSFTSPPLTDTEITLSGDMFARHFGIEKSASIPFYEAHSIVVYADTVVTSSGTGNVIGSEEELSAPADVRFRAFANTPVASLFVWKIFNAEQPDNPLISYANEEVDYTFDRQGSYIAKLEVSDRTGSCYNDEHSFEINITETVMEIPNAFSPGCTPGINDIFRVKYKSVVRFQGWIFNRWGNELFRWTDPSQGWDGKYRGGYVPAGAYYYMIEYTGTDGKKRVKTGDVNVFRTKEIDTEISVE